MEEVFRHNFIIHFPLHFPSIQRGNRETDIAVTNKHIPHTYLSQRRSELCYLYFCGMPSIIFQYMYNKSGYII